MKKRFITGFIVLTIILLTVSAGCTQPQENPETEGTYIVGIDQGLSPWEFLDENGNPDGAVIELLDLIAKDQNVEFTYYIPVDGLWQPDLMNGVIDTEGTIVITPEREEIYSFVKMPFEGVRYTVVALDDSEITIDDVKEGRASFAIFGNSVYEQWAINQFGDEYQKMIDDGRIVIKTFADELAFSVLSGEVDAAIAGSTTMGSQLNYYSPLKFVGFLTETRSTGFVFRQDETELMEIFNNGLANVVNTQEFNDIVDKYELQHKKETYVVGIDDNNYPFTYVGGNGEYTGYDIEQIEWIADANDFDVTYKVVDWSQNINEIKAGYIDMWASTMTITPEREQSVAFSNPYYSTDINIGVKPQSSLTVSDLSSDALIRTVYGTTSSNWLKDYLGTSVFNKKIASGTLIMSDDNTGFIDAVEAGEYDFAIADATQLREYVSDGSMKIAFVNSDTEKYGIAMKSGNILLMDMINSGLAEFESSGKKAELMDKYRI